MGAEGVIMKIDDCANGSCGKTFGFSKTFEWRVDQRILFAIGGAVAGYYGMKLWTERHDMKARFKETWDMDIRKVRGMQQNKAVRGGLGMTIDGVSYFLLVEGMPSGTYAVWAERPYSQTTDFVGLIEKGAKGFRAYPPDKYGFGIKTDLPSFIIESGTLLRTLRKAVGYLGKPYQRAFRQSRAFKQALGRQFSRELKG